MTRGDIHYVDDDCYGDYDDELLDTGKVGFKAVIVAQFNNMKSRFGLPPVPNGYWRLGRVLEKYRVTGRVGVLKYTIRYFRVPFNPRVLPSIPGYVGYHRLLEVVSPILRFSSFIY